MKFNCNLNLNSVLSLREEKREKRQKEREKDWDFEDNVKNGAHWNNFLTNWELRKSNKAMPIFRIDKKRIVKNEMNKN